MTFHRCINYGSYWQAKCLVDGLRAQGHNALLLDHRSSRIDRAEWRCALRPDPGMWGERQDRLAYARKVRAFFAAFDALPMSPPFSLEDPPPVSMDVALVGSDEVWNLHHPWYGGKPLFYGRGLRAGRLASYAASFGNQSLTRDLDLIWVERLRTFNYVSVRDANSRRIVAAARKSEPTMVLDPVLQFPEMIRPVSLKIPPGYVALYGHGLPRWFQLRVRRWADETGRRIVSIGYRNWWADESWIDASPVEFAGFIAAADAVVTNFFHGCVFALVNRKPFATAPSDYRSNKVHDLINMLEADRHLVSEHSGDEAYADALGGTLDASITDRISKMRITSEAFLGRVLA